MALSTQRIRHTRLRTVPRRRINQSFWARPAQFRGQFSAKHNRIGAYEFHRISKKVVHCARVSRNGCFTVVNQRRWFYANRGVITSEIHFSIEQFQKKLKKKPITFLFHNECCKKKKYNVQNDFITSRTRVASNSSVIHHTTSDMIALFA